MEKNTDAAIKTKIGVPFNPWEMLFTLKSRDPNG
jgi:hypothetical protein